MQAITKRAPTSRSSMDHTIAPRDQKELFLKLKGHEEKEIHITQRIQEAEGIPVDIFQDKLISCASIKSKNYLIEDLERFGLELWDREDL